MHRLGLNHDGYRGERLDISATLAACREAARHHGWTEEQLPPGEPDRPAFVRRIGDPVARSIYISAGIHGDEPAGPLAILRLLRADIWPAASLWLIPCLNPAGMQAGIRTSPAGVDINRDYRCPESPEARGHIAWLERQPRFDLTLLLHEDWEANGFYCYELSPGPGESVASAIIAAVQPLCPIDRSPIIDGRPVSESGIIRPQIRPEDRPDWPEALWLRVNRAASSYTLEAPSDWPLETRANALIAAVGAAMEVQGPGSRA